MHIGLCTLPPNLLRWLSCFLRGRTCCVTYQGYNSAPRIIHAGVPQGGVLSPDLYNFFAHDQPTLAELHGVYADDSYNAESAVIDEAANWLTSALSEFHAWATEKSLSLAPSSLQSHSSRQIRISRTSIQSSQSPATRF